MVHATRNTWQKYVETMAREDKECHIVMADELDPDVEYVLLNK